MTMLPIVFAVRRNTVPPSKLSNLPCLEGFGGPTAASSSLPRRLMSERIGPPSLSNKE
jgi:hypothetical protein